MARTHPDEAVDLAILGGGLAGGLIALALRARRPDLRLVLVEGAETCGGNHIWSFFDSDVDTQDRWLTGPLVSHAWPGHAVRFPGHARDLPGTYQSIESERLDSALRAALGPDGLLTGCPVDLVTPDAVRLADGSTIRAGGIIDARGPGDLSALSLGYQIFLGQRLDLTAPHGLTRPVIMDATVDQSDGYRFVYLLPFGPDSLLVEDTYYTERPAIEQALLERRIADYAASQGWSIRAISRTETGTLPVCMGGDFERYWRADAPGIAKAGLRGGFFHALTGYSLPDAVRVADAVSRLTDLSGPALHGAMHAMAQRHWRGQRYYRMLASLLFRAADPAERYKVLARFYRLDPALIGRFYAGRSTTRDKLRILAGKPPVRISRAISALGAMNA
jgi:lycopene beta-cyclase